MKKIQPEYKHAVVAATVTSAIWFYLDAHNLKSAARNFFGWLLLFLIVFVLSSGISSKKDD